VHIGENMTLSIPEELHRMDRLLQKSKLTLKDAEKIGHKVKGEIFKRFG